MSATRHPRHVGRPYTKRFARSRKTASGTWGAHCPDCRWEGDRHDYKGPASVDAREHNKEKHAR